MATQYDKFSRVLMVIMYYYTEVIPSQKMIYIIHLLHTNLVK